MNLSKTIFQNKYNLHFEKCKTDFLNKLSEWLSPKRNYVERVEFLIDYNCHGGKNIRAYSLVNMVQKIAEIKKMPFGVELQNKAYSLACSIEILQSSLLVADDIADNSSLRRGKPCWYKREDVQMDSVNDSYLLESFVYFILKREFGASEIYIPLVDIYHEVALKTQIGQMLDLSFKKKINTVEEMVDLFSQENYQLMIENKTAYYTYYIPIISALILCDMHSEEHIAVAREVAVDLGKKFQIEDDFIDCYGDSKALGKIGKDIEEKKCSWLVVNALKAANRQQKETILKHYGVESVESRDIIKGLYDELELKKLFLETEEKSFTCIKRYIEENDHIIPKEVFHPLLAEIHLRTF